MLETLSIRNVAVIENAEVTFRSGLNIISGETGAGKSIVISSISLLLGSRASADLVREGQNEATVEGLFSLADMPWLKDRMENLGLESNATELLIKRIVNRNGRHRIYVNGELITLSMLQKLCDGLVDLCGQHEHQTLLRPQTQLDLLDRYGSLISKSRIVSDQFELYRKLSREKEKLEGSESERIQRRDFLKFQIEELKQASLQEGEDETLHQEKELLQSAEKRIENAEVIRQTLESDQSGVIAALQNIRRNFDQLKQQDSKIKLMEESFNRGVAELEDVALEMNRYLGSIETNRERLAEIEERLDLVARLRRKYDGDINQILLIQEKLMNEFNSIEDASSRIKEITKELESAVQNFRHHGLELSKLREKFAQILGESVTDEIQDLKMGDAEFSIELVSHEDISKWSASGADQIQFVVRTNSGGPSRPLSKIASGGELSRLMLAIRRVISDKGRIGVYLFDEIDSGIGGQTAFVVGKKLKSVAEYNQVICITHLPQVASFANHHLIVSKKTRAKKTCTEIHELNEVSQKEEIARMLGGPKLTQRSLESAAELLELAR